MVRMAILSVLLFSVLSSAAMAATIYVRGERGAKPYSSLDLNSVTLCQLKSKVAGKTGMRSEAFDLIVKYKTADGHQTLSSLGLKNGGTISIKPLASNRKSRQC